MGGQGPLGSSLLPGLPPEAAAALRGGCLRARVMAFSSPNPWLLGCTYWRSGNFLDDRRVCPSGAGRRLMAETAVTHCSKRTAHQALAQLKAEETRGPGRSLHRPVDRNDRRSHTHNSIHPAGAGAPGPRAGARRATSGQLFYFWARPLVPRSAG